MKDGENLRDGLDGAKQPFLPTSISERGNSSSGSRAFFRGSDATAVFCTLIVAMGPLQFGFTVSCLIEPAFMV